MPQTYSLTGARLLPQQAGAFFIRSSENYGMPLNQKSPVPQWYRARYCSGAPRRIRKLPRGEIGDAGVDGPGGVARRRSETRRERPPPGDHGGAMATTGSHRAKPLGERGRCERRRTKRGPGERCQGAAARAAPCVAGPAHKRDPSAARPIVMAVLRWKPV